MTIQQLVRRIEAVLALCCANFTRFDDGFTRVGALLAATGKGILHCLDFARVCLAGEGLRLELTILVALQSSNRR